MGSSTGPTAPAGSAKALGNGAAARTAVRTDRAAFVSFTLAVCKPETMKDISSSCRQRGFRALRPPLPAGRPCPAAPPARSHPPALPTGFPPVLRGRAGRPRALTCGRGPVQPQPADAAHSTGPPGARKSSAAALGTSADPRGRAPSSAVHSAVGWVAKKRPARGQQPQRASPPSLPRLEESGRVPSRRSACFGPPSSSVITIPPPSPFCFSPLLKTWKDDLQKRCRLLYPHCHNNSLTGAWNHISLE